MKHSVRYVFMTISNNGCDIYGLKTMQKYNFKVTFYLIMIFIKKTMANFNHDESINTYI